MFLFPTKPGPFHPAPDLLCGGPGWVARRQGKTRGQASVWGSRVARTLLQAVEHRRK
jgi:hypothetical protein